MCLLLRDKAFRLAEKAGVFSVESYPNFCVLLLLWRLCSCESRSGLRRCVGRGQLTVGLHVHDEQ